MDDSVSALAGGSPYTEAQAQLAVLVEAATASRRALASLEARRIVSVHEAIEFVVSRARAFVSPRLAPAAQRDLARRAVIAELAVAWRVSEFTMQRLASDAYTICTMLPATLDAMRGGELDGAQARVIAHAVGVLDAGAEVLASADAELAALALTHTPAQLRHAAKRLLERLQAETRAERHARAYAHRSVQLDPAPDGMAWLAVQMRAADALLIRDRLQGAVRAAMDDPAESRTCAQLEADLARDLLLHAVPSDEVAASRLSAIRPTVHVTVPVLSLLGADDAPADLDGYGPIDAETARRLAAQAPSFTRLLTHPITGAVLDVDRDSYRVPADLRRWLQVRDGTCRFPGCTRRALRCEVDHSADWAADHGATAHDNLAHLCALHHRLKHETAWSLRHLEGAVLEWTSLTGAVYRTTPHGDLRAGAFEPAEPVSQGADHPDDDDAKPSGDEPDGVGCSATGSRRRRQPAVHGADATF